MRKETEKTGKDKNERQPYEVNKKTTRSMSRLPSAMPQPYLLQAGLRTHERNSFQSAPSHVKTLNTVAWCRCLLIYRCGGSAGFVEKEVSSTTHQLPV